MNDNDLGVTARQTNSYPRQKSKTSYKHCRFALVARLGLGYFEASSRKRLVECKE
jgi:hypothetical protein